MVRIHRNSIVFVGSIFLPLVVFVTGKKKMSLEDFLFLSQELIEFLFDISDFKHNYKQYSEVSN